jgi:hypothetical protein
MVLLKVVEVEGHTGHGPDILRTDFRIRLLL